MLVALHHVSRTCRQVLFLKLKGTNEETGGTGSFSDKDNCPLSAVIREGGSMTIQCISVPKTNSYKAEF